VLFISTALLAGDALAIRPVDPIFVETDCQPEVGVHPSAVSVETEVVSFNSIVTPGQVPVVCPQGFQAGEQSSTSTGGTCAFSPAAGSAGTVVFPATAPTQLVFSCLKNTTLECSGGACEGKATVKCLPIPSKPSPRVATEMCRTPGLYGQLSALSTAMMAATFMGASTETLEKLQGGQPLPTAAPAAGTSPNATAPEQQDETAPAPQSLNFPGRKPPVTAAPGR